ncbi:MAG: aldo/keto reductase [SAR202 cluster bacterium]|nr:aldo/keto reductase [SAR202 cluster bacterium]
MYVAHSLARSSVRCGAVRFRIQSGWPQRMRAMPEVVCEMEMTTLGKTGLKVSRLGVGLVEIGFQLTGDKVQQAGHILNAALDGGINFLDTAECYGVSEELIGQTVAHRRHEFVLATKTGHAAGDYTGKPWTADAVRHSIERSLRRMKTDYLDIVQLHAYDVFGLAPGDVIQAALEAKRAGKVRFVGYSQENAEALWAVESGLFDTLQTAFSIVDQKARYEIFPKAMARGMGIIGKRPIANAMWGRPMAPKDYYGGDGVAEQYAARSALMLADSPIPGAPPNNVLTSLGFVLGHPEVHTSIVGTRNAEHMKSNVEMVNTQLPLPKETIEELHRRYDNVGRHWRSID